MVLVFIYIYELKIRLQYIMQISHKNRGFLKLFYKFVIYIIDLIFLHYLFTIEITLLLNYLAYIL